jgi:TATA-binding protein-associated factor
MSSNGFVINRRSLNELAPLLFPFFRHTISNVRVAVVRTLLDFIRVKELPVDWVDSTFLRLIFQNVLLEERDDVRSLSLQAWRESLQRVVTNPNTINQLIPVTVFRDWIQSCTTPIGDPIDVAQLITFNADDDLAEAHNIDKNMISQDLSLLSMDVIWKARIACARCLAILASILPVEVGVIIILHQEVTN